MKLTHIFIVSIITILFSACTSEKKHEYEVIGQDTVYVSYFKNGTKSTIIDLKQGKFTGRCAGFYENGKYKYTGNMVDSLKYGVWKFYTDNESLSKVVLYYNDTIVHTLDKEDFASQKIVNLDNNLATLSIPVQWDTKLLSVARGVILTSRKDCPKQTKFCPTLVVTKDSIGSMTFEEYLQNAIQALSQRSSVQLVENSPLQIDSLEAYQIKYISDTNGLILGNSTTFIHAGNTIYILDGASLNEKAGDFLMYSSIFEEITNSFKVKK
ncbi:hypothetical protein [Xanthocytophaga agilis]|uniref:Lipoprotein n=1 Tax=Xanthocytophaga agilis TaxID=3048010 RepID=A0AAE3R5R6_9BACT|nr:hypothetical protein [Xanthocytophaga agilis]MDJ1501187.1 hypothetical protein [Xanthocytophaga agilis]